MVHKLRQLAALLYHLALSDMFSAVLLTHTHTQLYWHNAAYAMCSESRCALIDGVGNDVHYIYTGPNPFNFIHEHFLQIRKPDTFLLCQLAQ
jgi:hypothetical protein